MTEPCCFLFWTIRGLLWHSGLSWDARGGALLRALPPRPLFAQWRKQAQSGAGLAWGVRLFAAPLPPQRACWGQVGGGQQPLL